jgi:hypothetical protein
MGLTERALLGLVIFLDPLSFAGFSQKQSSVAQSTTKAEYAAAAHRFFR